MQKTNQQEFRIEKVIKKKKSYMSNGKVMIVHSIAGLIKKSAPSATSLNKCNSIVKMSQYFPKPY